MTIDGSDARGGGLGGGLCWHVPCPQRILWVADKNGREFKLMPSLFKTSNFLLLLIFRECEYRSN